MATPESRVVRLVKAELNLVGAYSFRPVQSGMGSRTLDFLGCSRRRFFAVECKAEGKKLTSQQEWIKQQMELAGARVFVINTVDQNALCWVEFVAWLLLE